MHRHIVLFFSGCLLTAGVGCQTVGQQRRDTGVQMREDVLLAQEEARRVSGRVIGVEEDVALLRRQLHEARTEATRGTRQETEALQQRLAALERRLDALEAARVRDREEIVAALSKQMAEVLAKRAPPAAARPRTPATGYGYEHTIQPGETLSAIATAYKVSSKAIIDANNLKNPDRLQAGQVLFIPE